MARQIKVTKKEVAEFIMDQPDDREVNFDEFVYDSKCGCLMVQYGKARRFIFGCVGFMSWFDNQLLGMAYLDGFSFNYFFGASFPPKKYSGLKRYARKVLAEE